MSDRIFVVPRGDSWAVRREGELSDTSTHASRDVAVEVGEGLASRDQCELVVHDVERRARAREAGRPAVVARA